MNDLGFHNAAAARAGVRRLRLRQALRDVQASTSAILRSLDHGANADSEDRSSVPVSGISLAARDLECRIGGETIDLIKCDDVSEQQLLEGADLFLQFLDRLHQGLRHGQFAPARCACVEDIAAPEITHRISEDPK